MVDHRGESDRSILIIANPSSGRGRGARTAQAVLERLRDQHLDATVQFTSAKGDAERLARDAFNNGASAPRIIVACGGDGTVQEVAHALATLDARARRERPSLGVAPAGRCNDFARAFGISQHPVAIADVLMNGSARPMDLGRVNGRHFCTVATAGIDAEISQFVDQMRMPLTGTIAYLYGALRVLARYRPRRLRIEGDFGIIDRPVFLASSANTSSYGGAVPIAPGASPCDGQLDLCVIEFMSKLRALRMVPRVLRGAHVRHPGVQLVRTRRLTIQSAAPLELWADGELVGSTPATIEVVPGAVRVVVPAGAVGLCQNAMHASSSTNPNATEMTAGNSK